MADEDQNQGTTAPAEETPAEDAPATEAPATEEGENGGGAPASAGE